MTLPNVDLVKELSRLKKKRWIKVRRSRGNKGGIGNTIEDYLHIPENNSGEPDCTYRGKKVELKAKRSKSGAMLTLFSVKPEKKKLDEVHLMKKYSRKKRSSLYVTLDALHYSPHGLRLKVELTKSRISIVDKLGSRVWVWSISKIRLKLHNLCIIYVDSKRTKTGEFFRIEKAVFAEGLKPKCFFGLVAKGAVKLDLRMHLKPSGAPRDHGTAFRALDIKQLLSCYSKSRFIVR